MHACVCAFMRSVCLAGSVQNPGGVLVTDIFPIANHTNGPPFNMSEQLVKDLLEPVGFQCKITRLWTMCVLLYIKSAACCYTRSCRETEPKKYEEREGEREGNRGEIRGGEEKERDREIESECRRKTGPSSAGL